jgi:hypothetical protein
MKTAILGPVFYLLSVFITFYGCQLFDGDGTKPFIPGTYTRHYKDEFTDSYDTIFIEAVAENSYRVKKLSCFQKINDEQIPMAGSEVRKWMGTYDKGTGTLFLSPDGKTIFFDRKNGELRIGTEPYKKQN